MFFCRYVVILNQCWLEWFQIVLYCLLKEGANVFDTTIEMNGKNCTSEWGPQTCLPCFMLRATADGEMVGAWYRTGRLGDPVLDIGVGTIAGTRTYPTFMAYPVDMQSIWDGNTPLRSRWMWNFFFLYICAHSFLK